MASRSFLVSPLLLLAAAEAKRVVVVGGGWGGLSTAHALSKQPGVQVTVVDAAPRVGGLVSDSFLTPGGRRAEAGQHGFWDEYSNIFGLLDELGITDDALTGYAEQGQYSPAGLQAVWPVYRDQGRLPTGLAQALYTRFLTLGPEHLATAAGLLAAFAEFDDSEEARLQYDQVSFRDLCKKLGVSKRLYDEAFEPMILTGLFAPGEQCSAAAALGMAYFFVLKHQTSFDVRWCRGNVGDKIFTPWCAAMRLAGVEFVTSTRTVGFEADPATGAITAVRCRGADTGGAGSGGDTGGGGTAEFTLLADDVVLALGAPALASLSRASPTLSRHAEFRQFCDLRGTGVLATRLFLDRRVEAPFTANACWGFDAGVGMTFFDISALHAPALDGEPGSVFEVDYYHAASLLSLPDADIVAKAKADLDTLLGGPTAQATVLDAAVVRLPTAVNWYFPGSYRKLPAFQSSAIPNIFFAGDLVRSRHGSWSQEKAFVTGVEAANAVLGRPLTDGIVPLAPDEPHVKMGRAAARAARTVLGGGDAARGPSLADFLWR